MVVVRSHIAVGWPAVIKSNYSSKYLYPVPTHVVGVLVRSGLEIAPIRRGASMNTTKVSATCRWCIFFTGYRCGGVFVLKLAELREMKPNPFRSGIFSNVSKTKADLSIDIEITFDSSGFCFAFSFYFIDKYSYVLSPLILYLHLYRVSWLLIFFLTRFDLLSDLLKNQPFVKFINIFSHRIFFPLIFGT